MFHRPFPPIFYHDMRRQVARWVSKMAMLDATRREVPERFAHVYPLVHRELGLKFPGVRMEDVRVSYLDNNKWVLVEFQGGCVALERIESKGHNFEDEDARAVADLFFERLSEDV